MVRKNRAPMERKEKSGKIGEQFFYDQTRPTAVDTLGCFRLFLSLGFLPMYRSIGYNMICTLANNIFTEFSPILGDNHILHIFRETVFKALFTFLGGEKHVHRKG